MWLSAPNISCTHGFSTRSGGISSGPFESLNLGGSDDLPENIRENRRIAMEKLAPGNTTLSILKQVHGSNVCFASGKPQEADAQVTADYGVALVISVADCYPLLFHDPVNHVIGAAHAGWRGTCSGIAASTVTKMKELGAEAQNIQVAIGQGISAERFEVGQEVVEKFKASSFPPDCYSGSNIDLIACNRHLLLREGIQEKNIWSLNRCTYEPDFFSYRRDKGITGRMWGLIYQG